MSGHQCEHNLRRQDLTYSIFKTREQGPILIVPLFPWVTYVGIAFNQYIHCGGQPRVKAHDNSELKNEHGNYGGGTANVPLA